MVEVTVAEIPTSRAAQLARKVKALSDELTRPENSVSDKASYFAQRTAENLGLSERLSFVRRVTVELNTPPPPASGLRDLIVRRATARDVSVLSAVDGTDPRLLRARLVAGDLGYVAEAGGEILAQTWFHRGPAPFEEERWETAVWALDEGTFWSYHGVACLEARTSGVYVKCFRAGLLDVFHNHGAQRVQGNIEHTNWPSLAVHRRLGFVTLGRIMAVASLGMKWLEWTGPASRRTWLVPRNRPLVVHLPPS
jgi:hypothetical protein